MFNSQISFSTLCSMSQLYIIHDLRTFTQCLVHSGNQFTVTKGKESHIPRRLLIRLQPISQPFRSFHDSQVLHAHLAESRFKDTQGQRIH